MGATTGIVGATVVTLGLLTLPALLRRGYDKGLACGTICASGTLGQIIPPSLILILLADILDESVGTLFAAAMIPGLMLAGIYMRLHPRARHRPARTWCRRCRRRSATWSRAASSAASCVRVVLPPIALVGAVLGSIIGGIAAPTEAASMGALGVDRGHGHRRAHVAGRCCARPPRDHPHHRDDDVHPDLRAGVLARVPRPAGRAAGRRTCSPSCRAASMRDIWFLMVHHLHPRLLHRVDRDLLHRGAAVPAGASSPPTSTWCGWRR